MQKVVRLGVYSEMIGGVPSATSHVLVSINAYTWPELYCMHACTQGLHGLPEFVHMLVFKYIQVYCTLSFNYSTMQLWLLRVISATVRMTAK